MPLQRKISDPMLVLLGKASVWLIRAERMAGLRQP